MSPFRFGKRRVIGGITAVALGCGLLGASAVLAAGPPTPNPLAPKLSPTVSQLSPRLQPLLQLGGTPVPGVDITGNGQAVGIHGSPVAGAPKFVANCAVCHADRGVGGVDSPGSDYGTVPAVNPIDPGFIADASGDAAIFARDLDVSVQHGSRPSGKDPQLVMPAWGDHGLLSQADIADIEAYVMELNRIFWPDRCPGIRLKLGNPSAAAFLQTGSLVVQGTAVDTRAAQGSGIDHIDFFLDDRDAGGRFVGTTNPNLKPGPGGRSTFQTTLSLPSVTGGHLLVAYAFSWVNSQQAVHSVPVAIGVDASKAFVTPPTAQPLACTP